MMRALIVDDSRATRMIVANMLGELAIDVSEACNGREALAMVAAGYRPEVLLVDWNMPEMSGIEFVGAVREAMADAPARILMVTVETEPELVSTALAAGVDEYLMKPFSREAFFEKLQLMGVTG